MSRKGGKPHPRRTKPAAAQGDDTATVSVLPMDIQIGDRFTDEEGEWEVVSHPATLTAPRACVRALNGQRHRRTSVT